MNSFRFFAALKCLMNPDLKQVDAAQGKTSIQLDLVFTLKLRHSILKTPAI